VLAAAEGRIAELERKIGQASEDLLAKSSR
jgi:hypothetical protein